MDPAIISREHTAQHLAVAPAVLLRYEACGLVTAVKAGATIGYGPSEIRRLWTIVSLQRDLGINVAGVEAVLKLQARLDELHKRLEDLADQWSDALEMQVENTTESEILVVTPEPSP
jgi:MerR family transcriptional regulator/heat shock protein HspR